MTDATPTAPTVRDEFRLDSNGISDTRPLSEPEVKYLETARRAWLCLHSLQSGGKLRWQFVSKHDSRRGLPRHVHVQSSDVRVVQDSAQASLLHAGWFTQPEGPCEDFWYFPSVGVIFMRERDGARSRWVPFAYRANRTDVGLYARKLSVGSGPPLVPTVVGHIVVSPMGTVYVSTLDSAGTLAWEELVSPWPLWFDQERMCQVAELTTEVRPPVEVQALKHLQASLEISQVMSARARTSAYAVSQTLDRFRRVVEMWLVTTAAWSDDPRSIMPRGELSRLNAVTTLLHAIARDVAATPQRFNTLWHLRLIPKLKDAMHAYTKGAQQQASSTLELIRALLVQWNSETPQTNSKPRVTPEETRERDAAQALTVAVYQAHERVQDLALQVPEHAKPLTAALQAFFTAFNALGLYMNASHLDLIQTTLARVAEPVPGERSPREHANRLETLLLQRTVELMVGVMHAAHTNPNPDAKYGVSELVRTSVVTALEDLRSYETGRSYLSGDGVALYIEHHLFADAVLRSQTPFFDTMLRLVAESLLGQYRTVSNCQTWKYADPSAQHAHLLYVRESLALCLSLYERVVADTTGWTAVEWTHFASDLHTLWKYASYSPKQADFENAENLPGLGTALTQRALSMAAATVLPAPYSRNALPLGLQIDTDDTELCRIADLKEVIAAWESLGIPEARQDPMTGERLLVHPGVDVYGDTPGVRQVRLTHRRGFIGPVLLDAKQFAQRLQSHVVYVGPASLVEALGDPLYLSPYRFSPPDLELMPEPRVWLSKSVGVLAEQAVRAVVTETQQAAWRSAAKQSAMAARDLLVSILKTPLKAHPRLSKTLTALLKTDHGEAVLSYVMGVVLESSRTDARSLRLARELRVVGEATAFSAVIDPLRQLVTAHFDRVLSVADQALISVDTGVLTLEAPKPTEPFVAVVDPEAVRVLAEVKRG